MKTAKFFLGLNVVVFIGYAAAFIVAPGPMSSLYLGAPPANAAALVETRAIYGGMGFGLGLFYLLLYRRDPALGVRGALLVLGAIVAARLLAFAVDGVPSAAPLLSLAAETAMAIPGIAALRRTRPAR